MPRLLNFPDRSDEELARIFGSDTHAVRRYRLLHDLLLGGKTQRAAARAGGVSERTVRNTLRRYKRGGLKALRTRRAAGQRDRLARSAEWALAAALAAEPAAGGDRLWRHAQALLRRTGVQLSRRTAYRILKRLRAPQLNDIPDDLYRLVRAALPLLIEDPPLELGKSLLAGRLLPAEPHVRRRGEVLQRALAAALAQLRPASSLPASDRRWWPYRICAGEYLAGDTRGAVQARLAISASTYSRAKRRGLEQISAVLPQLVVQIDEAPAGVADHAALLPALLGEERAEDGAPALDEWLAHVRRTLHLSAAHLRQQRSDRTAQQLAAQLAALTDALPELSALPMRDHPSQAH